jgi:hypothetical protein
MQIANMSRAGCGQLDVVKFPVNGDLYLFNPAKSTPDPPSSIKL